MPNLVVREVTTTFVHAHGKDLPEALRILQSWQGGTPLLVPMDLFISEPTKECNTDGEICVTLVLAHPGTGQMIENN